MVCAMEAGNSNDSEELRSSNTGLFTSNTINIRQSHKISIPSPASMVGTSTVSSLLQRNTSSPPTLRKIMSKNHNNTVFLTSYPSNFAELQLYRVMQNASLLCYYDTLLEMGGDDVQQLCDAGEEEFLEIMSLVGMASKPLHVRRLQKSLQEWVTNPHKFKLPLAQGEDFEVELSSPRISSNHGVYTLDNNDNSRSIYSPSSGESCALPPATSPGICLSKRPYSPLDGSSCPPSSSSSPGCSSTSLQLTPILVESQIAKLAHAAERLSKQLPQFEPKPYSTKKKMSKELELVMMMPENDPRRMDEIRRYAAIYGRFDCKRRPEKPLTLHEVSVNEAAAQICRFMPALLTRRDELFPLARQVVKDAGCHYSKTQVSSTYTQKHSGTEKEIQQESLFGNSRSINEITGLELDGTPSKRLKLENIGNEEGDQGVNRQEKCSDELIISRSPLQSLFQLHTKSQLQISGQDQDSLLVGENNYSHSTTDEHGDSESDDTNLPQVIAVSGDNIIAVANPALAMSSAIFITERETNKSKN